MTQPGETSAFVLENARERKMIQNMRWKQLAVREFIASSERPDWW